MPWVPYRSGSVSAAAIGLGLALLAVAATAAAGIPLRGGVVAFLLAALGLIVLAEAVLAARTIAASRSDPRSDTRRLKEEFLATVSHELRTPLNAILGWTELLRTPKALPPQEVDRGLEVIERNARRQLALVEELLAVADTERSRGEWQRIDLGALMHALFEHLEEPARAAEVALQEDDPDPPASDGEAAIWVLGDPAGLRLALRHILENAVKFTPAGGLVRTRLRRRGADALIAVSDTGPGIDPAVADRVFEPFRQQDASATRAHGGLGLGLTIARRLIESHGGRVDVRSAGPGHGATFVVTLPRASD